MFLCNRGLTKLQAGQAIDALSDFELACALDPDHKMALGCRENAKVILAGQAKVKELEAQIIKEKEAAQAQVCRTCHLCSGNVVPPRFGGPGGTCAGCRKVRYCSVACQTADWAVHKARCRS